METEPRGCVLAYLAKDQEGHDTITCLVKRTYELSEDGRLQYADEQDEFVPDDYMVAKETEPGAFPVAGADIYPFRIATDVVVTGDVVTPEEKPAPELIAGVQVGRQVKRVKVLGDRWVEVDHNGRVSFTAPEPFSRIPMEYTRAYGGLDPSVQREEPTTPSEIIEACTIECHPGVYPRNPVGQAYVVNPHRSLLDGRPLPNLEDPDDLLSPERIVVRDPQNWWRQPMPASLGWFGQLWYPRCALAGIVPPVAPDERRVKEVELGLLEPDHITRAQAANRAEVFPDVRFYNGASPGLALPHLKGNEPVRVAGMDPRGIREFNLPGDRPDVRIAFENRPLEVEMHLHTVWIQMDDHMVNLVWSANAVQPRQLPKTLPTRDQPVIDELEDVEITVDGRRVPHEETDAGTPAVGQGA